MTKDLKIEMLEALQCKQEAVQMIVDGARLVVVGGVEGIQEVAQTHPETIITVIDLLASVIENQQKQQIAETEDYLELLDEIEKFTSNIS